MTLNIDIDGVLFPFEEKFKLFSEDVLSKELPEITQWDIAACWGITKDEFHELIRVFILSCGFLHGEPTKNSVKVLTRLKKKHTINIVTSRSAGMDPDLQSLVRMDTSLWLNSIPHHNLIFTKTKYMIPGLLLDDNVDHLRSVGNAVCFDKPWNQDWEGNRVKSWLEFEKYVKKYDTY
jgi:hypothetical protein